MIISGSAGCRTTSDVTRFEYNYDNNIAADSALKSTSPTKLVSTDSSGAREIFGMLMVRSLPVHIWVCRITALHSDVTQISM